MTIDMTATLLLALKLAVGAIIFAIGMGSKFSDVTYLWKRPGLLIRSLLAMYVLVPLAAIILVKILDLPQGVEIGLLVLAVSAGAPLLPRKLINIGRDEFVFSLVVNSTVLAIFAVPAWLVMLGPQFGSPTHLEPLQVARIFAKAFFLPLLAGMMVRRLFSNFAHRFSNRLMGLAGIALTGSAVSLLVLHWKVIAEARWEGILTLAALTVFALFIGHILGGPAEEERTTLAVACATRHIGVAALVATSLPGPNTAVIVSVYIVTATIISIPYLRWRRRTKEVENSRSSP